MNEFIKAIRERVLVYDGSKGYLLQKMGLGGGECAEEWNLTKKDKVREVYLSYRNAGSDVIQTNTFPGNRCQLEKYGLADKTYEINFEGARLACEVMGSRGFVAASVGPTGRMFEPAGDLTFEEAYNVYKEQIKALADGGVDVINFETFTDLAEMRAALIAARETCDLPVICSMTFEANGKTLMGTDPYTAAVVLKSLGADMVGTNCSLGPEHLLGIIREMSKAGVYLSVKPNAGLPEVVDGKTVYCDITSQFTALVKDYVNAGVRLIGGCCGTTPELIAALKKELAEIEVPPIDYSPALVITSGTKSLCLESGNLSAGYLSSEQDGELADALKSRDLGFIADKALELAAGGYDYIYIDIDSACADAELYARVINEAQGYIREPFILKTENLEALEKALRIYRGKAGVILPEREIENMKNFLAICSRYGSTIIDPKVL